jgi:RNA polymerase sigma factor (sigma-70 family)
MSAPPGLCPRVVHRSATETRETLPVELTRLLEASPGPEAENTWTAFLTVYSALLLRVASTFGPDYDSTLDRYAYMLDELRRNDCRRLRAFAADGRSRFSTWLAVVARRLCLDQYRLRYGRLRGSPLNRASGQPTRVARRRLADLWSSSEDLALVADPSLSDPGDQLDADRRRIILGRAVASLPPSDQLLLRLRFEEELSAREIARLIGLPTPFHVYRRLATVCARLRACMEPDATGRSA